MSTFCGLFSFPALHQSTDHMLSQESTKYYDLSVFEKADEKKTKTHYKNKN